MTKWYLYEVMITGVMDVIMVAFFGVVFYFLMKWYVWMWFKRMWILLLAIDRKMELFLKIMNIKDDEDVSN
ncbi:MAG: hypothetical protein CMC15_18010 [Flavobacteriaceae bacterium]|jgi:hypothetical protein|nr:hypothetical protein [Flavobacteriaceae bacterium]|tara:strand:- start:445 stop:657 length:213 start_codon:yes stop_codon:yes gene_type:complete